eukprot:Tamp_05962.p1 GENE.Tamp_05962~~Tamp_05962.p1  ORF type:complete len:511 (-),score=56.19 Tamp_05962:1064-2596(-)
MTNDSTKKKREAKFESSSDSEDEERFKDFTQVVIPVEEERMRTSGLPVRWSAVDKEDAVKLSDENLTASCHCGYRAIRATHGVSAGCWYFELEVRDANKSEKGEKMVEGGGHCRVGWAMDRVAFEDLEAPIGYSPDMDEEDEEEDPTDLHTGSAAGEGAARRRPRYGMSFSYASKTGAVYTRSRRIEYGESFAAGDVVGCMIELTEEPPPPINPKILNEGTKYHCPLWMHYWVHKEAAASPHARISFFKNGKFQGYAFEDIWCGTYYPAASFYYGGCATANFGPDFRYPPQCPVSRAGVKVEDGGEETFVRYRPISESARELQVWNKVALEEEKLSCLSGAGSRSLTPPLPSPSPGLSQPPPRAPVPLPLSLLLVARRRCSCTHPPTSRSVPLQRSRFPCARDRRQRNRRQRTPHTATLIPSLCPMRQTHNGTARRRRRPQVQPRRRTRSARRARETRMTMRGAATAARRRRKSQQRTRVARTAAKEAKAGWWAGPASTRTRRRKSNHWT